jgi:hypothetical protein
MTHVLGTDLPETSPRLTSPRPTRGNPERVNILRLRDRDIPDTVPERPHLAPREVLEACQEEVACIRGVVDTRADIASSPAADLQEVVDAFQPSTGVVIHWHERGRLRFRRM